LTPFPRPLFSARLSDFNLRFFSTIFLHIAGSSIFARHFPIFLDDKLLIIDSSTLAGTAVATQGRGLSGKQGFYERQELGFDLKRRTTV
jgi:hypothetical protein